MVWSGPSTEAGTVDAVARSAVVEVHGVDKLGTECDPPWVPVSAEVAHPFCRPAFSGLAFFVCSRQPACALPA